MKDAPNTSWAIGPRHVANKYAARGDRLREEYLAQLADRDERMTGEYTEECAWCGEPAEDATGLGWPLCVICGDMYGSTPPPGVGGK